LNKTAAVIRHIHFEDLGTFGAALLNASYAIRYVDIGRDAIVEADLVAADLLIVLGGPIGVYETAEYPFLEDELRLLRARLKTDRPTFGICLGAQLMAAALGAKVYPSGVKEIGFSRLSLTAAGQESPLRHLAGTDVLHWHGDTFDIPDGALHLAETPLCRNQAFSLGTNVMGVQFHPEVDPAMGLEPWLVGHAAELSSAGISPAKLRNDAPSMTSLAPAGRSFFDAWLRGLSPR
jgi:GMP synthase (glutamine-hydrolysing)